MIKTTGAGFVSFFCHYPFNPQKPLHLVWRWLTLRSPTPPHPASPLVFLLVSTALSTGEHETSNRGRDALRWRLREKKRGMDREVEREREIEGGLISTSSSYSSKPASSSEARQDPACPRPGPGCLSAGRTSPAGPGTARRHQRKTIIQIEEKGVWGHRHASEK